MIQKGIPKIFKRLIQRDMLRYGIMKELQEGQQAFETGNYGEALRILLPKAKDGCATAQYYLGRVYENEEGCGSFKDLSEATKWYERAAQAGHVDAQFALAQLYNGIDNSEEDKAISRKWFLKAARRYRHMALKGNPHAQFRLGEMYLHGWGVKFNLHSALKWLNKATEHGGAEYKYRFALYILYGEDYRIPVDLSKFKTLLLEAAEEGYHEAQFRVGINYQEGWRGFLCNKVEAAKWFRLAVKQGHAGAQHSLAMMLLSGDGISANEEEGQKLLVASAEAGEMGAIVGLVMCYEKGLYGFPKDISKAQFWQKRYDEL